jgi:hypothetical protein
VRPQDITTTALLTIEGELDDITGGGQTKAAHGLCNGIPKNRSSTTTWKVRATTASSPAAVGARRSIPRCAASSAASMPSAWAGRGNVTPMRKKARGR